MTRTLRSAMTECGWPEHRTNAVVALTHDQGATVLLVTPDVVATRLRGALQCTRRDESTDCIARSREATRDIASYVRTPEYDRGWCERRGCDKRALEGKTLCERCVVQARGAA